MTVRESGRQTRISEEILRVYAPHVWVRVKHGTAYAVAGDPDIYGCVRGYFFGFEIKNDAGTLTKIQVFRLQELQRAGAICGGIRTAEGALTLIRERLIERRR